MSNSTAVQPTVPVATSGEAEEEIVPSSALHKEETSAAAHAFDEVMAEHEQSNGIVGGTGGGAGGNATPAMFQQIQQIATAGGDGDVVMSDAGLGRPASPAILPPARTGTPSRTPNAHANGHLSHPDSNSRANSQHPEPIPATAPAQVFPKQAVLHGAPTRQYLNGKVTTVLLEGMKIIARDQPKDPLKVLGEYLLQRSKEVEGT